MLKDFTEVGLGLLILKFENALVWLIRLQTHMDSYSINYIV